MGSGKYNYLLVHVTITIVCKYAVLFCFLFQVELFYLHGFKDFTQQKTLLDSGSIFCMIYGSVQVMYQKEHPGRVAIVQRVHCNF